MTALGMPEWGEMFVPDLSLAESFLRGSLVYLSLVVLFRVVLKRQGGAIGLPDVMLVVLVSECVSNSLGAQAKSIPNGLAAVTALLLWTYVLDRLTFRWPWFRRLLEPRPLQLVKDGRPLHQHLKQERISDDELAAQLRQNGIDDVAKVKAAFLESEGTVSVIPAEEKGDPPAEPAPPAGHFDDAVKRFVAAADAVRAVIARHEEQAEAHRAEAKAARELLARYGVRSPARKTKPPTCAEGQP
jgi:uncharacterized membrane protein YcaP (DUF421 family)